MHFLRRNWFWIAPLLALAIGYLLIIFTYWLRSKPVSPITLESLVVLAILIFIAQLINKFYSREGK